MRPRAIEEAARRSSRRPDAEDAAAMKRPAILFGTLTRPAPAPIRAPIAEDPRHEAIARIAHQLYVDRGCEEGHALDDWLKAEAIVRQREHGATVLFSSIVP